MERMSIYVESLVIYQNLSCMYRESNIQSTWKSRGTDVEGIMIHMEYIGNPMWNPWEIHKNPYEMDIRNLFGSILHLQEIQTNPFGMNQLELTQNLQESHEECQWKPIGNSINNASMGNLTQSVRNLQDIHWNTNGMHKNA